MTTIILVRHGENDWVKKNRLAGWIEGVHLNEDGRQQARDAAARLAHRLVERQKGGWLRERLARMGRWRAN